MRIVILGGSGFIGKHLAGHFSKQGYDIIITSRSGQKLGGQNTEKWDGVDDKILTDLIKQSDIVINLVGENIARRRWSAEQKQNILLSRVLSARALTSSLKSLEQRNEKLPLQVIQASACAYYGLWENVHTARICTEATEEGSGFLAYVCKEWEKETKAIENLNIKRALVRFSPVIGREYASRELGGFLGKMALPFRYYLGAVIGSGEQPFAWVHIDDVVQGIDYMIKNKLEGIFNISSKEIVSMRVLTYQLAEKMQKKAFLKVPDFAIKAVFGEMAEELFLKGQKIEPQRLIKEGYNFRYPELKEALRECID